MTSSPGSWAGFRQAHRGKVMGLGQGHQGQRARLGQAHWCKMAGLGQAHQGQMVEQGQACQCQNVGTRIGRSQPQTIALAGLGGRLVSLKHKQVLESHAISFRLELDMEGVIGLRQEHSLSHMPHSIKKQHSTMPHCYNKLITRSQI